jgi:hypothetical protein
MDKLKQRLQLLALVSIFFIYKTLTSEAIEEQMLWLAITALYLLSLLVSYIVITISEKRYAS